MIEKTIDSIRGEGERRFGSRMCGNLTMRGTNTTESVYARLDCKCWNCRKCGPKKAGRYKHAIRNEAERLNLRIFLTLTLDPKKIPAGTDPVRYLRSAFDALRHEWRRKFGEKVNYICVLELHQSGIPHLHLVIDRYMPIAWIKNVWQKSGGGSQVSISGHAKLNSISRYLSKYLTKDLMLSNIPGRSRRVTVSRGIVLNPKHPRPRTHKWEKLKITVWEAFRRLEATAKDVLVDEMNIIQSFIGPPARFGLLPLRSGVVLEPLAAV